jgi:hypothetical protein
MAYIKISDPKIIDLPTIHQIINVVNQHSDNISAITNNFGSIYSATNTSDSTTQTQFDIASQQILYGSTRISEADGAIFNAGDNEYYYKKTVSFTVPFTDSKGPIITAQPQTVNFQSQYAQDIVVSIGVVNQSSFEIVLRKTGINKANHGSYGGANKDGRWLYGGNYYINVSWIAIGHK